MSDDSADSRNCLNCNAPLAGQYCGQCGQRATNRLISLWELIRDAFGDLFELDSRLWRTMIPLLLRPGLLTRDYLEGRRARYMPPFRMYLVLSLIFFVVAFFDPREDLAILYEPAEESTAATSDPASAAKVEHQQQEEKAREILEKLVREGVIDESVLPTAADPVSDDATADAEDGAAGGDDSSGFNISFDDGETVCSAGDANLDGLPEFIQRRFSVQRLERVCERVIAVGGRGVATALLDRVPVALLILLPLIALVLKILYPLSRRYYVEHLLFFVHFHAFMFLLLSLQILWSRLVAVFGLPDAISELAVVATSFYMPVYLYMSMRCVYNQGHWMTSLKFVTLMVTYAVGLSLLLFGTLLVAIFSV